MSHSMPLTLQYNKFSLINVVTLVVKAGSAKLVQGALLCWRTGAKDENVCMLLGDSNCC